MHSLLDPAILFFIFGVVAASLKSNLEIPPAISRFLSLYLLMALGLKGGFALSKSSFTQEVAASLGVAIALAIVIPLIGYFILKECYHILTQQPSPPPMVQSVLLLLSPQFNI